MGDLIQMVMKQSGAALTHNTHRVYSAWNDASGAANYTLKRFYREGKLYITLNSSVVRNQLYFQKDVLIEKINGILENDELFIKDDPRCSFVKELILK